MTLKRYLLLWSITLMIFLFTVVATAQDATAVPTEDVSAETAEPTSELASATPLPTGTPLPTATDLPTLTPVPDFTPTAVPPAPPAPDSGGSSGSVIVIVISILTLVLGGGTLVSMITNFRKDAAGVAATEALGKSVPQELAMELVRLLSAAKEGAEIAIEALDNVPAAEKPPAIRSFTNEELIAEVQRRGYSITATAG